MMIRTMTVSSLLALSLLIPTATVHAAGKLFIGAAAGAASVLASQQRQQQSGTPVPFQADTPTPGVATPVTASSSAAPSRVVTPYQQSFNVSSSKVPFSRLSNGAASPLQQALKQKASFARPVHEAAADDMLVVSTAESRMVGSGARRSDLQGNSLDTARFWVHGNFINAMGPNIDFSGPLPRRYHSEPASLLLENGREDGGLVARPRALLGGADDATGVASSSADERLSLDDEPQLLTEAEIRELIEAQLALLNAAQDDEEECSLASESGQADDEDEEADLRALAYALDQLNQHRCALVADLNALRDQEHTPEKAEALLNALQELEPRRTALGGFALWIAGQLGADLSRSDEQPVSEDEVRQAHAEFMQRYDLPPCSMSDDDNSEEELSEGARAIKRRLDALKAELQNMRS